jgi:hypothetical protein
MNKEGKEYWSVFCNKLLLSLAADVIVVWGGLSLFNVDYTADDFFIYLIKLWVVFSIIQFFMWLKSTIIQWILYRINREKAVNGMVSQFREFKYPEPTSLEDGNFEFYMLNVIDDENIDVCTRINAAKLLASVDAFLPLGHKILSSRMFFMYSVAVARYKEEIEKKS